MKQKKPKRYDRSKKPGSLPYIWRRMSKNSGAMVGLSFLILIIILSFTSPYILKYNYWSINMFQRYLPPSWEHLLGTDELGRDILARILYGARYTLAIGIGAVIISSTVGIAFGSIAGYLGGKTDAFLMRVLDVIQSFPGLILAIAVSVVLGTGIINTIIAIGIGAMPPFARMTRASMLKVRKLEYVEAAHAINCSPARIIFKYMIQNSMSPLIVMISLQIAQSGLTASTLSFLGLGIQEPTPEWGSMIATSREFMRESPHMVFIPGLFIMMTVLSLNLIGDALRDALDPRLKD